MRLLLAAALCLSCLLPASAAQWRYEGGATPIAWIDTGAAQFQFACRGGTLTLGFWVRKPHATVAGASTMSLAITPDARGGDTRYAQDMPVVHLDGSSVIVRGPVARQWARIAQEARDTLRVAFVKVSSSGAKEALDATEFGALGSKTAIGKVLGECG